MNRAFSNKTFRVLLVVAIALYGLFVPLAEKSAATGPGDVDTGLLLWLDASDPDNDDNSNNNPADGTAVTTWSDKSGNSNDATRASSDGTPIYVTSSNINNIPAFRFNNPYTQYHSDDGTTPSWDPTCEYDLDPNTNGCQWDESFAGQVFEVSGVDIRATTRPDITVFAVYKVSNASNGNLFGVWGQDNGAWDRFFIASGFQGAENGVVGLGPTEGGYRIDGAGNGTTRLVTTVYDGNTSSGSNSGAADASKVYFDGALVEEFTDSTHITDASGAFHIGNDGDDSWFNGDIAEIIIYDRVLSDSEITDVSVYLADKYGVILAPTVTTNAATSITGTTATLNASVNAHGATTSELTIRYSTDSTAVGSGTSPTVSPTSISGSTEQSVLANITGLTINTTYYFRVSATNSAGTNIGEILSFTTTSTIPPAIVTSCDGAGSLTNGSFENQISGWNTTATDGGTEVWGPSTENPTSTAQISEPANAFGYSGQYIAEIAANSGGGTNQGLYQDVSTIDGSRIFWSYWHKHRAGVSNADQVSKFRAGPTPASGTKPAGSTWTQAEQNDPFNNATLLANVNHTVTSSSAWSQSNGTFVANSSTTRFLFSNVTSPSNGYGNLIDDVRFTTYSACPISVTIVAGRNSNYVVRNNEQSATNFQYYAPQAAVIDNLSAISTGLTASVLSTSDTSSAILLGASTAGTYTANYAIRYSFGGTTYNSISTLTVRVVPEVTSRAPSVFPVDPTLSSKTLSGISFGSASSIYLCIDQVDSNGNVLSPSTITVNQGSLVSGVTAISSSPFIDSATVSAMTSQMPRVRIQSNSGVLGRGGTKYIRVRAASIDNTDGVARSCDNGISYRIEIRIMPKTKVVRKIINLENGKQRQ